MLSISALAADYRSGRTTPTLTVTGLLTAIRESTLNAFISVDEEEALSQASMSEAALQSGAPVNPMHGIPVAIKDLIDVAGMRTTMGSEQYAQNVATEDAEVVKRLRAAGAIILGKTNTHEFAYGPTGDRSFSGAALNPHDPAHVTGGSSSGSAAALAAGLCAGALGTDTSASIRLPASLCGVVGLKPTLGSLPTKGVFPLSHSLDHVGPMTTTVWDNALMMDALIGGDKAFSRRIGQSVRGRTVGFLKGFYTDYLHHEVRDAILRSKTIFEEAGARIVWLEVPGIQKIYDNQQLVLKAEAYEIHKRSLQAGAPFHPEVRDRLLAGTDLKPYEYARALAERPVARQQFEKLFSQADVLLTATSGITAPKQGRRTSLIGEHSYSTFWLLTRLTAPTNFSGQPSISIPFEMDSKNLPIGLQLIAKHHDEATLYQFAAALERPSGNIK